MKKIRFVLPALAAVAALALAGCTNSEGPSEGTDTGTEATAVNIVTFDDIKAAGVLVIATDAEYPPNEYKDEDGNPTGWGVELANAIAEQLGVEPGVGDHGLRRHPAPHRGGRGQYGCLVVHR